MSIHTLPAEILDAVCRDLSPTHLAAFARSAKPILPVARRLLYREISISTPNLFLVHTLAEKPSLALHVRTFTIRSEPSSLFDSFYRLLAIALANMKDLTSLSLFVDPSASWVIASPRLPFYPRLSHFASSFSFNAHVAAFLTKADALLQFEIDNFVDITGPPIPPLPSTCIPRLSKFIGCPRVANAIVPGRPVHTIHLLEGDITETDIIQLAKSSAPIIIFDATTSCQPTPLLDTFTQFMPRLNYLRILTTCNLPDPLHLVSYFF